ncbi:MULTISPECIES: ribonuclease HII [Bifidobacterium]|jgi:ribonuclease HII|uniref:ribonuclease HII n=1 Tax=Bifidobacterium TaxID=1678 RepID=UPI000E4497B6|nr:MULTISPECIES: ribonuclease HII [Bifidobacterium]MBV4125679.1 ribonuclease HII [Bifidobacterium pseudocatenulatum]MBV4139825.1 ribonuclease HII [Bifidobacterium sp. MSK.13.7]MBV4144308.1 ribonuclease HII [Bifidobacterium sp. MSK.13.1]MDB6516934.1 ribonuclease HII [Bifidobacterium pseudocatenulatum]MDB6520410.1 ribonuclease HII [Bifidobacterium pseudocatenulatum]
MAVSVIPTLDLERAIAEQGYDVIVGFDEVGRGSLAGPVMVGAAAIWARDLGGFSGVRGGESAGRGESGESGDLDGAEAEAAGGASGAGVAPLEVPKGVADSKMLTERKREAIFDELEQWCAAWAVGAASNTEIDEWGISYALGVAALRALAEVERKLGVGGGESAGIAGSSESSEALNNLKIGAILDGPNDYITKALNTFDAPDVPIPADVTCKVKGDRHCATVATAAVIAKVTRDRLMVELAAQPQYAPYEWANNKGYGSAAHRDAIAEFGPSDLHRLSWHLV